VGRLRGTRCRRGVIVDAGIKIVETAGSNPAPHLPMFHDNGIKVLHKFASGGFADARGLVAAPA
jgi:NAD(P)H-dependent flavin oxidoreductase YrpB (nitropropane dioxygenase family)